jgi:hypothetical protein
VGRLRTILAVTMIMAWSSPAGAAHAKPADLAGHSIGESAAAFLREEPEAQQKAEACRQQPDGTGCAQLLAVLEDGQRGEISTSGPATFLLDGGQLVRLTMPVDGGADAAIASLTKKFGPPSRKVTITGQNLQGTQWENYLFGWDTADSGLTLYQDNDPSLQERRLVLVAESRSQASEDTVSVKELGAQRKRTAQHAAASVSPQTAALR